MTTIKAYTKAGADSTFGAGGTVTSVTAGDATITIGGTASAPTVRVAASTYQPLDSDLTAIAALATTAYGRNLLGLADAAALRTAVALTAPLLARPVSVAYAATVNPNADTTDVLNVAALTGNLTLAAPTGAPVDGQALRIRLAQDATGGRTVTFNAAYAFGTDITTALVPTAASAKWEMMFAWHAGDAKWRALAIARGF